MRKVAYSWIMACLVAGAALGVGCSGDDDSGTTASASSSTSGSGGGDATGTGGGASTGTGGDATSTSSGTGGGGGAPLGPFSSQGAASYEAQTTAAANEDGTVVVAWIGFFADNTSAIGVAISQDGGETFTPPAYVDSPGGRLTSNPVLAADGQGQFYLAWLGFRPDFNAPDEHIYVSKLDKGKTTFNAPAIASDDGASVLRDFDKPSIGVDANDNVLLTWADFTGSGSGTPASLTFARSTDGSTFTRTTIAADATFGNLASLCLDKNLGPSAPIYVVHLGAGATVTVRKSTDQGQTWPQLVSVGTSVVFQDPTCVASGSDVWVAYATGTAVFSSTLDSPGDAIELVHSSNSAGAFSPSVKVASTGTTQFLFPRLVQNPNGKLLVAYYEGTLNNPANLVLSSSPDGSAWTPATLGAPGTFTIDRTLASWLGGYLGAASTSAGTYVSFTENTLGKAHIGFAKAATP